MLTNELTNEEENYLDSKVESKVARYIAFGGYGLLGILGIFLGTITGFQVAAQSRWLFLILLVLFFIKLLPWTKFGNNREQHCVKGKRNNSRKLDIFSCFTEYCIDWILVVLSKL